jgi:SAM-dependent methyltransferase
MPVDEAKLQQLMGQVVSDWAASFASALVLIGDQLGLYTALNEIQPATPAALAERTGTAERYVREWLLSQAAGGYVRYDADSGLFGMTEEQAAALADPESPTCMLGGFQIANSVFADAPKLRARFLDGDGIGWGEHHHDLFEGTERLFAPGYRANLVSGWLPALEGVVEALEAGARVADVGCGHGISTLVMAEAFPRSRFTGYDGHPGSIATARERAGSARNVEFEVAEATSYDGDELDLVCYFDALHDMGDPVAAVRHAREQLAPGGTIMAVEPYAGDRPEDNFNPVGRLFYSASTMLCVPNSLAGEGVALGAQAGTARLAQVFRDAGCSHFRRACETPFNLVFEGRA